MLFLGCQPDAGDAVHLDDPIANQLVNLGQKNYKQSRSLPYLNDATVSYCEVGLPPDGQTTSVKLFSGFNDKILYPSASLSKLFLTAFVIYKLGVDFQFTQSWKVKNNADGSFDAYLDTGFDPIFNIEKALYAMSVLNQSGIRKIRNLYISPYTRIYLSVLAGPHLELDTVPVNSAQSIENLKLIFNSKNWGPQTEAAQKNVNQYLQQKKLSLKIPSFFSIDNVQLANDLSAFQNVQEILIYSSPVSNYLKEINVNSNNYLSDAFFNYLGGADEFAKFQMNQLKLSASDLVMNTGSGLSMLVNQKRVDNLTTCRALLKTVHYLKLKADQFDINLGHLLLTAGVDQGTYDSTLVFNRSVVLKTGRLFEVPTLNLAGLASTQKGLIAFAFLGHNFNNEDENIMKQKRDDFLSSLMMTYKATPVFESSNETSIFFE